MLYVVLMPFMSALAPSEWLPLPLLLLLIAAPAIAMRHDGPTLAQALRADAGFWAAWLLGCAGMVFSPIPLGGKNLNYAAAILVSYLMFFVVVRAWLHHRVVTTASIVAAAHLCLTLLSIAVLIEFYTASFHGIFFADVIHYAHDDLNVANLIDADFKRPRAFATEPGFTALCFECLWPLTMASPRGRPLRHALYAVGFAVLGSAAALVSLLVGCAVVWVVRRRDLRGLFRAMIVAAVVVPIVASTGTGEEIAWSVLGRKLDLTTAAVEGGDSAVTVLDRVTTYDTGLALIESHPAGVGWGALGQAFANNAVLPDVGVLRGSGMLSLYLDVGVAAGIAGLVAFLTFIGMRVRATLRSPHPLAGFLSVALIALCTHHALVTELQFPFLWFALALADRLQATWPTRCAPMGYLRSLSSGAGGGAHPTRAIDT